VTNDKIFDQPVYNYTHEFPYLWEEMTLPIAFKDDRKAAEKIMLEVAQRHTEKVSEMGAAALEKMRRHYTLLTADTKPRVYFRITDNWLELSLRFIARASGTRDMKDKMSREILAAFEHAGIAIASATYDIVGLPPIRVEDARQAT
ncbi:MAG TPA: hypothetical protein VGC70_08805, partial [Burkholderiales bacterium]